MTETVPACFPGGTIWYKYSTGTYCTVVARVPTGTVGRRARTCLVPNSNFHGAKMVK